MDVVQSSPVIAEVLLNGPADGQQILQYAQSNNLWEALYLASRSSDYALQWREVFGQQRPSQSVGSVSILELAVRLLMDQADTLQPNLDPVTSSSVVKLIANCCADNDPNRRVVLHAGGLLPLIKLLEVGADPNILIPTIYNMCVDIEDPAENVRYRSTSSQEGLSITIAEERLARTDVPTNSVYSGIVTFLKPEIVARCSKDIKDYLADLVEMSARPAAAAQEGLTDARDGDFGLPISRLLADDGGKVLLWHSPKGRISVSRALIALCTSNASKGFLASSGIISDIAEIGDNQFTDPRMYGDNWDDDSGDEEIDYQGNVKAFSEIQTAILKLVYEVCQLPQFLSPPKYGVARQALQTICGEKTCSEYRTAVAFIMLYSFIDNNARAGLLASENLIPCLVRHLEQQKEKMVLHPALGVANRLAVAWSLRKTLYAEGAVQAIQRLLLATDLGFDIPQNAITFFELMIKGHPEHVQALISTDRGSSIMQDIFVLFGKRHDAICLEIGRFVIELCATLAQQNTSDPGWVDTNLETLLGIFDAQLWADVLIFMGTKAQELDPIVSQRVWFALGLISSDPKGKEIVLRVLQSSKVTQSMKGLEDQRDSWAAQNIRFMLYNMRDVLNSDLDFAMNQMSLG